MTDDDAEGPSGGSADAYAIRAVRADEWVRVKELRLLALQDPMAPLAFLETHDSTVARPDEFWQQRAAGGPTARQFVAETATGDWVGSVTALVEQAGAVDFMNTTITESMGHLVGVFVLPGHRGSRLAQRLLAGAVDWCWSLMDPRLERVRLFVHEENVSARRAYRKLGFAATGTTVPFAPDPSANELELAVTRSTFVPPDTSDRPRQPRRNR